MSDNDKAIVAAMLKARELGVQMLASDCEAILSAAVEHCKHGEPSDEVYALRAKNAYLLAQLATNSIPPQPPCDNNHVADGCDLFAHAMPKSEDKPVEPKYFSITDGDNWFECPDDSAILDCLVHPIEVGAEYEVDASYGSFKQTYRVVKVPDEKDDDYLVELVSSSGRKLFTTPQPSTDVSELDQPRLTVRLVSFPESNGKRNWTAQIVRVGGFDGLVGTGGGITIAHGELWNRVAYEAERTKYLLGERDTEPHILDYGDDIKTPEEWAGEVHRQAHRER